MQLPSSAQHLMNVDPGRCISLVCNLTKRKNASKVLNRMWSLHLQELHLPSQDHAENQPQLPIEGGRCDWPCMALKPSEVHHAVVAAQRLAGRMQHLILKS